MPETDRVIFFCRNICRDMPVFVDGVSCDINRQITDACFHRLPTLEA